MSSARARSDRLNPVFLKELRQALRGKRFAILFATTVAMGVALTITVLVDSAGSQNLGPRVFQPVLVVLAVAVLGLVPFSAFLSTSGEWDEGTHDLLVLSHLAPTRIVLGKLLTAAIESGLYVSAFLPLLLFTFLLSGVDVRDVLFLVAALYAASLGMSCVAMSLAGLSRNRFWRVILLASLAGIALGCVIAAGAITEEFVVRGRGLGSTYALDAAIAIVMVILVVGTLAFTFAATRVAHAEDDRSGPVRVALTAMLVTVLLWLRFDPFGSMGHVPIPQIAIAFGVASALFAVFFVTEPDRLPRRTATRVPSNGALAVLATPFLPGGGRGVLWWLLQLAILAAWGVTMPSVATFPGAPQHWWDWGSESVFRWASMMAYFAVYLAGFSLAMSALRRRSYGPLAARMILPAVAVLSMVVPMMIGFLVEDSAWTNGEHALMPFWVATDDDTGALRVWALLAGALALIANGPRLARSVQEVLVASRARRELVVSSAEAALDVR